MSDELPKPAASPRPPDDSAPLEWSKTPSHGVVPAHQVPMYVKAKLEQAQARYEELAREAAREAVREASNGKPVLPRSLTMWFFAGFTMCGSITTVAMSFEGVMPRGMLVAAAVGTMFFGGMLGLGSGLRK